MGPTKKRLLQALAREGRSAGSDARVMAMVCNDFNLADPEAFIVVDSVMAGGRRRTQVVYVEIDPEVAPYCWRYRVENLNVSNASRIQAVRELGIPLQ